MLIKIFNFIALVGVVLSNKSKLKWNLAEPYRYNGFIYTDSHSVVINPAIQIKISNNEEICNFYINKSESSNGGSMPLRAVVKSAHLGIAELEIKSNTSLWEWRNKEIIFSIVAEACHDPDSWSVPASVSIKVLDPPGPIWTKTRYSVVIRKNTPPGTAIVKVTAYLSKWTDVENRICQYLIRSPRNSPFQIDGEGTIRVTGNLLSTDVQHWNMIVVAEDCTLPLHRWSQVNVLVSIIPLCKFGWTGFYTVLKYLPGSGIRYLSKDPKFHVCEYLKNNNDNDEYYQRPGAVDSTIKKCIDNKSLRLTTSVELKAKSTLSADAELSDQSNCKLDFQSLKLQREVCGISDSYTIDLLSELTKQNNGAILFPIQANIFPVFSLVIESKFSFYFWMKKSPMTDAMEEYITCQIDEIGNNIFSVSLKNCILRIQLKSYENLNDRDIERQSLPTSWAFSIPQLCDNNWHHVSILAARASENPYYAELSTFIDGEMVDYRSDNPEVQYDTTLQHISSNMTDLFLGQCPKSENTEFKGLLAGVSLTPGVSLKSSSPRCLTKCSERLYFNGMNQMNPGMSVSLNSEMQMIIINGHNIDEVTRLVKVIGFVNPTWNPMPGDRNLTIETEMSCGNRTINVSTIKVTVQVAKQKSKTAYHDTVTVIKLFSTVSTILIPDSTQTSSDMGTGVALFANTSLEVVGIPQSTDPKNDQVSSMISKCTVTMHPRLQRREYIDWPRHLIEVVSGDKNLIKVTNTSRSIIFHGRHNQEIYQFIIQHLRYFGSTTNTSPNQGTRIFKLQCFSSAGKTVVKSNVDIVKVTIWYNKYQDNYDELSSKPPLEYANPWKEVIKNITIVKNSPLLHSQSNAALISEIETPTRIPSNVMFNVLFGLGMLMLLSVVIMIVRKARKQPTRQECFLPNALIDRICLPLLVIKERIIPGPSVRVELSRDFAKCSLKRRRDIGMEMQWDDSELKANGGYNIITNPIYETSIGDIDDMAVNRDVPPQCEHEGDENSTDDDTYDDFTDLYFDHRRNSDIVKKK